MSMISLIPRRGGEGERVPGTHCLCMCLIATEFRGDRVCMCTYVYCDVINSLHWDASSCAVGALFEWVLYRAILCLLVAGYLEIKLKKEQVASSECVYRRNMPLCGYPPISVSPFLPRPTRQFSLHVPNSITVGRACSSDVSSILRTKAELIFMTVYAIHVNRWSSY